MGTVKGKIAEVFETQVIKESFKKREFILEIAENPKYPENVKFELQQDKCIIIDQFSIGDEVEVGYNLRGRSWQNQQGETSYFNTISAWFVKSVTK